MYKIKRDEEITLEVIQKFATEHRTNAVSILKKLADAYNTRYDIMNAPPKPHWKPDNRLQVNFASYIVDTMTGFFAGVAPSIDSTDADVNDYVTMLNAYNVYDDLLAEETKRACIYGYDYELLYVDERGNIGIVRSDPMSSFMIYDDSVLKRKRAFVRLYKDEDEKITGSVSDERMVRHFQLSPKLMWTDEEKQHGFDGVPAVEYVTDEERQGMIAPVLSLIDAYNKALSEKANDVDYFADAYLKILGALLNEEEIKHIRDDRVINFDGTDSDNIIVDFLQKPSGDETQEHLLDRLEENIFKIGQVADISNDKFATASGIALKYKMLAMSNKAQTIERKFHKALQERYRLAMSNATNSFPADAYLKIDYKFVRNFPANLAEEVEIVTKLEGVVSKETQLKQLSVVPNAKEEIERIEAENPSGPIIMSAEFE